MYVLIRKYHIEGYFEVEEFVTFFNKIGDGINACDSFELHEENEDIGIFLYKVWEFKTVREEIHSKLLDYIKSEE